MHWLRIVLALMLAVLWSPQVLAAPQPAAHEHVAAACCDGAPAPQQHCAQSLASQGLHCAACIVLLPVMPKLAEPIAANAILNPLITVALPSRNLAPPLRPPRSILVA